MKVHSIGVIILLKTMLTYKFIPNLIEKNHQYFNNYDMAYNTLYRLTAKMVFNQRN